MSRFFDGEVGGEIWSLVLLAGRLDEAVAQSASAAEPSHLAKYTLSLAHAFNSFYMHPANNILRAKGRVHRAALVVVVDFVRRQLTSALAVLGIEVPEQM
jgi:arginyl-tRNA synthetase